MKLVKKKASRDEIASLESQSKKVYVACGKFPCRLYENDEIFVAVPKGFKLKDDLVPMFIDPKVYTYIRHFGKYLTHLLVESVPTDSPQQTIKACLYITDLLDTKFTYHQKSDMWFHLVPPEFIEQSADFITSVVRPMMVETMSQVKTKEEQKLLNGVVNKLETVYSEQVEVMSLETPFFVATLDGKTFYYI